MLTHTELKKGIKIVLDDQPWEVMESQLVKMAQRRPVMQTKIHNLVTGAVLAKNFQQADIFEEAEIEKIPAKFLYSHREKFCFCETENPSRRFDLSQEQIGSGAGFLSQNQIVDALKFGEKIINISLPIKVRLKIIEATHLVLGERSQAGTKIATVETGAKINVPLFIKEGDIVEVNTETGEYNQRM